MPRPSSSSGSASRNTGQLKKVVIRSMVQARGSRPAYAGLGAQADADCDVQDYLGMSSTLTVAESAGGMCRTTSGASWR